jgi:hypothetical protein
LTNTLHIMRLQTMVSRIRDQLVEEKIINTRLNSSPDSIYTANLYSDIESLQTSIELLKLHDPHFKRTTK